jgi:hypothetical protein
MPKPANTINWGRIANIARAKGCVFALDITPLPTGSGKINKFWFNFFLFEEDEAKLLVELPEIPDNNPFWEVLVDTLSEVVFNGVKPFCRYVNQTEKSKVITYEWLPTAKQASRFEELARLSEIISLRGIPRGV